MVQTLSAKVADLDARATCPGDWIRLQAAVMRTAIAVREQLEGMRPSAEEQATIKELVDELHFLKLYAEARLNLGYAQSDAAEDDVPSRHRSR